jgi:hypothetical protein
LKKNLFEFLEILILMSPLRGFMESRCSVFVYSNTIPLGLVGNCKERSDKEELNYLSFQMAFASAAKDFHPLRLGNNGPGHT